jgi:hypothetical protein
VYSRSVSFVLSPRTAPYEISLTLIGGAHAVQTGANWNVLSRYPACQKSVSIVLPAFPTAEFALPESSCPESAIYLQPDNYNPQSFEYSWSFVPSNNPANKVDNPLDKLNFMPTTTNDGPREYEITLHVKNKYGCEVSRMHTVTINAGQLERQASAREESTVCYGGTVNIEVENTIDVLNNVAAYQWYRDRTAIAGANSRTLTVNRSGYYWAALKNADGCELQNSTSVNVTVRPDIIIKINDPETRCLSDNKLRLTATVKNTTPAASYYCWTTSQGWYSGWKVLNGHGSNEISSDITIYSTSSSVTVTLEVRDNATGCSKSQNINLSGLSDMPDPCNVEFYYNTPLYAATGLFEATIIASNLQTGTYTWSNGMTGSTIRVDRGGTYKVTFVNASGCSSEAEIFVPRDPKEYMWIVPENGCFLFCHNDIMQVIGPSPYAWFSSWDWLQYRTGVLSGTNWVRDLFITTNGDYSLLLNSLRDNGGKVLTAQSSSFSAQIAKCSNCNIVVKFKDFKENDKYPFYTYDAVFTIQNPNP